MGAGFWIFASVVLGLMAAGLIGALFHAEGRWLLFQGAVVFLVCWSNLEWHWTPNHALAGLIGFGAALIATLAVNLVRFSPLLVAQWRARRREQHQLPQDVLRDGGRRPRLPPRPPVARKPLPRP